MPTAKYQGKELKEGEEIVVKISFDKTEVVAEPETIEPEAQTQTPEFVPELVPEETPKPQIQEEVIEPAEAAPTDPHYVDANKFLIEEPASEPKTETEPEPMIKPQIESTSSPPISPEATVSENPSASTSPQVYSASDFLQQSKAGGIDLIPTEHAEVAPVTPSPFDPTDTPPEEAFPPGVENEVIDESVPLHEYHNTDPLMQSTNSPIVSADIPVAIKTRPNIFVMGCLGFLFLSFIMLLIVAAVMLFSLL